MQLKDDSIEIIINYLCCSMQVAASVKIENAMERIGPLHFERVLARSVLVCSQRARSTICAGVRTIVVSTRHWRTIVSYDVW